MGGMEGATIRTGLSGFGFRRLAVRITRFFSSCSDAMRNSPFSSGSSSSFQLSWFSSVPGRRFSMVFSGMGEILSEANVIGMCSDLLTDY